MSYYGIAPDAALIVVNAFGEQSQGSYPDVIRCLDWVWQNQPQFSIRVVNLSFSATPQSHYWDDLINQAVMRLWQAGIVVVASAGNTGPNAMTIGVPGNVPYIVTVDAMTNSDTPDDRRDDRLTWFTAAGPTQEGFVKPDLVAPGGHRRGVMPKDGYIPRTFQQFHDGKSYFAMSGTSQATAMFPQVESAANQGLDLAADIEGTTHYRGRANRDANSNYYIEGLDGFMWNDSLGETMSTNTWVGQQSARAGR